LKIRIHWGNGYVKVEPEFPTKLTEALRYWQRRFEMDPSTYQRVVKGQYRDCYQIGAEFDDAGNPSRYLLTMPGFMHRIKQVLSEQGCEYEFVDERTPFPDTNYQQALAGLRDYQLDCAYTSIASGGGIFACPTGFGKCLGINDLQLYYDGTVRPAKDVKVGDRLMGDDSKPRTVLNRIDGKGTMYRITPKNGVPFTAADHHILSLVKSGDCKRDKYPDGHIVAITIEDYLRQSTTFKRRHKLYKVPVDWPEKPVDVDPYWLGLWLGDGSWNNTTITNEDPEVIDAIQEYAARLGMRYSNSDQDGRTWRYSIVRPTTVGSNKLLDALHSYGLAKSRTKFIPYAFKVNARAIRLQLLAGLLDSNGGLNAGTDFDFISTNEHFANDVTFLARSLGFRVHQAKRTCKGFDTTVAAYRLHITGHTHLIPTKVLRKQATVRKQSKDPLRTSFTVTRIDDAPYVGVQLDGNQRYLLGDFTVTHNTHIIAAHIRAFDYGELCARNTPLTVVACKDQEICRQNADKLSKILPTRDVGLVMSGVRKFSDDVQIITLDSLHHINAKEVGVMIVDEVHEAATDKRSELISQMVNARRWGCSATPSGRFDGSDKLTEGLIGPIVYQVTYQQGVDVGALVPITVLWLNVPEPHIGLERYMAYKMRKSKYDHGVEQNKSQIDLIVALMQRIPDTMQTLAIMQHTAQMNALVPRLPGIEYVHAKTDQKTLQKARQYDLVAISAKRRKEIYADLQAGKLRKVLSTHVYKQGVDFPEMQVMIQAGGGGSAIAGAQIPGRASRPSAGKQVSVVIDFWHPWDVVNKEGKQVPGPVLADDRARDKIYSKLGFERHWMKNLDDIPFLEPVCP
jgi:superfamily II DNA or RNA helicase